jgi:hypothetical protein
MTQKTNNELTNGEQMFQATPDQIGQDFKNAVFIVSVVANLSVFTAWVTLQVIPL